MNSPIFDFIAIGLGPFNLGLAALTHTLDDVNGLFLDKNEGFDWHPGMMLESAHLQTPFLSDLVTLADPTHPLSFLNYIKKQGRLYSFYIRENFFLMRKEYNQYCQWAAEQMSEIRFQHNVTKVTFNEETELYKVDAENLAVGNIANFYCKHIVLGTGPVPHIPDSCLEITQEVTHTSKYLFDKERLQQKESITIVGGGQSAAEIYYDLLQDIDTKGYQLNWVTRSPRFFPLEYSKLTLEMTSPEYVDYFYHLPAAKREELISKQKNLYKGINVSLINDIFDLLYVKRLSAEVNTHLMTNTTLETAHYHHGRFTLGMSQDEQGMLFNIDTQGVVLATGYVYQLPEFLEGIRSHIQWDNQGRFDVNRNYSVDKSGSRIFVQNAELHTHGFVTPDLGMACYRNSVLIKNITGVEHYSIEKRIAFQEFATPVTEGALALA
ncbi:lysine N(6)-hydroxylase/L-ornithine N(5)-oxygenase family protein [Vibrio tetraodonis]|uniref:lysine N(6)-hydroxylase/L-ornithine N(5)-oxygenase family protein n=1 Tax=Vibrio tetraodonis TaxID=2231647 RepID=UPI000E0C58B2|nr:lysine N(6)-hydroxylase/L-ornithine N(5)-oxygenase family protein [Vibrio tetraodonis]